MTRGGKNLVILGVVSILITVVLTVVSLAIYHYSGDIYLDRSRPGFLPDEEEVEEDESTDEGTYEFPKTGVVSKEALDEYLEKIQVEVEALDAFKEPFGDGALSDAAFGLDVTAEQNT